MEKAQQINALELKTFYAALLTFINQNKLGSVHLQKDSTFALINLWKHQIWKY